MNKNTIFKRLVKGEIISPEDPESYKLKEASYNTKRLLLQMNNTSEPQKIRQFLSQIIDSEIDKSVTIFTPFLQNKDIHLFLSIFTLKKMLGLVQMPLFYME